MKTVNRLGVLLVAVIGLTACSTINTRIAEKASVFESLDPAARAAVARGDVGIGYTPDMVYIAFGDPDVKRFRTTSQGTTETWIYRPLYADAYPMWGWGPAWGWDDWGWGGYYRGYHRHYGYGMYGGYWPRGPYGHYPRDDDVRVTFQNGRVVAIDQPRR